MAEQFYEITFRWPSIDAGNVIVTGTFDGWSSSTRLTKTPSGFEGTARVPYGTKVTYKYIVDGRWTTADGQPTECDPIGNVNNVYSTPAAPPAAEPESSEAEKEGSQGVMSTVRDTVAGLAQTAAAMVEQMAPSVSSPTPNGEAPPSSDPCAPSAAAAEPASVPVASESSADPTPEPASAPVTPGTVLPPAELAAPHLAPDVPLHVLPLEPVPPAATIVEGTAVQAANGDVSGNVDENGPSTHEVAGEPVVGAEDREKAIEGEGVVPKEEPITNGAKTESQPPVNGSSEETAAVPATNGTPSTDAETKLAINGTTNGTPVPASPTASPPQTPAKEKRMRFPSLSARHSRRSGSSANTSLTELGESAAPASPGSPGSREKLDTHASRAAGGETVRRKRMSIFGKIKGIFDSPHPNGHGKRASHPA